MVGTSAIWIQYCAGLSLLGALGGGRTHTWRILSPLPLPLGYEGRFQSK